MCVRPVDNLDVRDHITDLTHEFFVGMVSKWDGRDDSRSAWDDRLGDRPILRWNDPSGNAHMFPRTAGKCTRAG